MLQACRYIADYENVSTGAEGATVGAESRYLDLL